jgi:hypothetical protein
MRPLSSQSSSWKPSSLLVAQAQTSPHTVMHSQQMAARSAKSLFDNCQHAYDRTGVAKLHDSLDHTTNGHECATQRNLAITVY